MRISTAGRPLALAATIAAMALAGCGGGSDEAPTEEPGRGGTLTVATAHDITGFNQLKLTDNESIRVISQITEGLFKTDANGRIKPWLATKDRVSDDGLTHTLTLRKGVRFSDGTPMTSKDVKFTLERSRESQWGFILADLRSIETPDDATVVLRLRQPVASLHAALALFANGIMPADFGGRTEEEFARDPIGTGPFVVASWDRGTRVVLARNPRYWVEGRPLLDRVELVGVPDDNSRVTQLRGGQVDLADRPPWPEIDDIDRSPGVHVETFALAQVDALLLNTQQAPMTDRRVREAVSLAIDRESIVQASLAGHGEPSHSFLAPSIPYHFDVASPPREEAVARAKALLEEAGSPQQTIEILLFAGNTVASTAAQVIQQNLRDVGLTVRLVPLDQSAVRERGAEGEYTAAISAITSDIVDPSELSALYFGTNGFSTFSMPPGLARIAARAARESDGARRSELYAELQRGIVEDYGFVPLQVQPWAWGVDDRVQGFTVNATGIFDLSTVGVAGGA